MKHRATRALYGYWNDRRGGRAAPDRAEIDPTAIPRLLADTFLLGLDASDGLVFRLAGTRVGALFCRELKGERFVALFRDADRRAIHDLAAIVREEAVATVAGLTGHLAEGPPVELELLLLPLRHHGRLDTRILGLIVPVSSPYWLGMRPVEGLALGSLRHVGLEAPPSPLPPPIDGFARVRHGLIVYDGGRS